MQIKGQNTQISALNISLKNQKRVSAIGRPWLLNIGTGIGHEKKHIRLPLLGIPWSYDVLKVLKFALGLHSLKTSDFP